MCFNRPIGTIDLERVDLERVWGGLETDYKNIKGVGKSTLELMDEFIKTGSAPGLRNCEGRGRGRGREPRQRKRKRKRYKMRGF